MGNLIWVNTNIPEDVMQNSVGSVVDKDGAFNTSVCTCTTLGRRTLVCYRYEARVFICCTI